MRQTRRDGSNRVNYRISTRVSIRVPIFLHHSKPDRITVQKIDDPLPVGAKKNLTGHEIRSGYSSVHSAYNLYTTRTKINKN